MTVAEFLEWEPDDRSGALWQLRDGEPEMMAPASDPHGSIQVGTGFPDHRTSSGAGSQCRIVTAPGVVPSRALRGQLPGPRPRRHLRATDRRAPDARAAGADRDPVPHQRVKDAGECPRLPDDIDGWRRSSSCAPPSIAAEVLRRGPDGAWPQQPEIIAAQGELRLDSIGFVAPLRDAYRTTGLV